MSVKGFCNIQNFKAIYDLLNWILHQSRYYAQNKQESKEEGSMQQNLLQTREEIDLYARNR